MDFTEDFYDLFFKRNLIETIFGPNKLVVKQYLTFPEVEFDCSDCLYSF